MSRLDRFWFEPVAPLNLAACRVILFGALFLFYLPRDFSDWSPMPDAIWRPVFPLLVTGIPVASEQTLNVLQVVWKLSLLLACLGLLTRVASMTAFVLGLYLLGMTQSFGTLSHVDAALVLVLGVMGFARSGDALALDRLLRPRDQVESGEYRWPIRLVWVVITFVLFLAALSKLRASGLDWVFSDNFAIILLQNQYYVTPREPLTSFGLELARLGWLTQLMAGGLLLLEFVFPLTLFSRWARALLAPGALIMLVLTRILIGPDFTPLMICFVFWVPWDCLLRSLAEFRATSPAYLLRARGA